MTMKCEITAGMQKYPSALSARRSGNEDAESEKK